MRYVFLFLIFSLAWAADPVPKLPADVQKVVDAREAEVAKAKAVYDAAVAKATAAASKNMEVVIKARMAKQDLEGAVVAKAVVTKWGGEDGDLLGEVDLTKFILGTWNYTQGEKVSQLTFNKDGSITTGSRSWEEHHYKINGNIVEIYTSRNTIWTKFVFSGGKLENPDVFDGCEWKQPTKLERKAK